MIDAGRRKIANRLSPNPGMVTLTEITTRRLCCSRTLRRPGADERYPMGTGMSMV